METRFIKTAAGQAEIIERNLALPRTLRNLLLLLNESQPVGYWLRHVQGASRADIKALLGFSEVERKTFAAFFRLSQKRAVSYVQTENLSLMCPPPAKYRG